MNSSRYMLVDERHPYSVKRRVRGPKDGTGSEPAITLLPPDPYLIMERPDFIRSPSPTMYRAAPPKSAKNKEASSFVILGETIRTPVQSRPGSPSGRVSPFRGRGFKSPTSTRPNSRLPSPSCSPKKIHPSNRPIKVADKPRIGRDIGLPPKSPMKPKPQNLEVKPATTAVSAEKPEEEKNVEASEGKEIIANSAEDPAAPSSDSTDKQIKAPTPKPNQLKAEEPVEESSRAPAIKQRLTPSTQRVKKSPVLPTSKMKHKNEKSETNNQQSAIKKTTKPPIPPKKVGLKTTLKTEESTLDRSKKSAKEGNQGKSIVKETEKKKEGETVELTKTSDSNKNNSKELKEKDAKENESASTKVMVKTAAENPKEEAKPTEVNAQEAKKPEGKAQETKKPEGKAQETKKPEGKAQEAKKPEGKAEETKKSEGGEGKPEKVVPCFQPDRCQIAPPTMASPSPIVTPTMSTPSTTADLASSSMKSSQSIAAAPTTVTPSSLSSVSSTVVLTGNLVRKEIEGRNRSKESDAGVVRAKETKDSNSPEKVSGQMVKAASRDSIKWSSRDSLSGEITSTTKVIKGEPEMEVLSPNNLRESPPRIPPPNMAWDEGRLPNGDVPNKPETEGKFRRFITTIWRFLCYIFLCRCYKGSNCCRRTNQDGTTKPSIFSRFNCCKSCRNPFKNCTGCCKWNCCKCGGKQCCRKNTKQGNPKTKSRKCCAKASCSCKGCCEAVRARCLNFRYKINSICRSFFCLNTMCCQNFLRKFRFCHKLKCCQKNGFCSCCNPNVKKETRKLNKKGSRASNNSRDKDNLDVVLVEHTSLMKAAIPVLPSCLAVFCLILNLFVPGFGTFISGILCLCFGKPRFSVKDTPKNRMGSFIVNTIIGVAQLFTVVFCLVGWGWSVWWGVIMYKLSRRQKRLKLAEKNQKEAEGSNVNHNHVDVEQG